MTQQWLIVHSSDERYGADRVLLNCLDAMTAQQRLSTRVWLPTDLPHGDNPLCPLIIERGVRVDHVPLPILRRAQLTPNGILTISRRTAAFRSAVAAIKPDVVYGMTSATMPALAAVRGLAHQPRVLLHNQEVWQGAEAGGLAAMAANVDAVVAISQLTRNAMPPALQGRTTVVPNMTPDPGTHRIVQGPSADPSQPLKFLAAGRWTPNKGFDVLIDAWSRMPAGELTIVGGPPPSGPSLDLAAQIAASPARDTIQLVGEVADIDSLVVEHDVVLMPSTWPEPFGLVALEGMAAQRAVIVSNTGGLPEFVDESVGWLAAPGDPQSWADVFATITRAEVVDKAAAGRTRYLTEYSPAAFAERWRTAVGLNS